MKKFKRSKAIGFFDEDFRLQKLTALGDPLIKLNKGVDFEIFRSFLVLHLAKLAMGKGGRPPYDYVLMFKILILQRYYNLSDSQTEFQINDRMSFMRFLKLTIADDIPDSKTIWLFKEQLIDLDLVENLFALFVLEIEKLGLIINKGKIVDASFIEIPIQRNTIGENKEIKEGKTPQSFTDKPNKLSQKDVDARSAVKNKINYTNFKLQIF